MTDERDQRVLQLFLAGATYSQIATATDIDLTAVHETVVRELETTANRRGLLAGEGKAVYQERAEALFKAHWAPALRGDHKSAEICRKILEQQARMFASGEATNFKGDVVDEISARRAARRVGTAARSPRTQNAN